ncbi:flagellar hook-basal body complex protein FliE [Ralstonia pseudosolanacearum]|uniref:Flagellar hook-basal body complex protein FliE n=1 Tax=Ralstonia solanacearum TaxID=305 RepID=A0AA92JW25_RALSL|nr:flagellar hook-basal body complex protein FliE [Ralstonia pseudosolanacearum]CBJ40016.1 Flagellar hook-basal body complex protein fliE [Ralstonia solanacearum CMR15]QOK93921.1 flagellar hook-basal body complex protein FliE [Ralstonia pseudosolanacearum]QOK98785.1 flagellar hook-basal body complex protein FliE [Ralstonia pseudosolanacearum]UWD88270.1 flagellar hook-basal body complex protein FliE [Ralstonia pseudosolanacearum]CAH0439900.1 Flagellar hook-basal body complex protein FliE [Ralst
MDITNANSVVSLMNSVLAPSSKVGGLSGSAGDSAKVSIDFGAVLKSSLDKVDASQQKAETLSRSFELGNNDVDLHDVMLSLQKANIDLQTAVQVRNKMVSAYQNIMSMSI